MPSGSVYFSYNGGTSAGETHQIHPGEFRADRDRIQLWREEQKLLIDSGRYIRPITTITLQQTEFPEAGIVLPSREVKREATDWFTGVVMLAFILVAVVRTSFGKYLRTLFHSTLHYPSSLRLFSEQNISHIQGALLMELLFYLVIGLFGFQIMKFYGMNYPESDFLKFLICFGTILVFFLLKSFVYSLLGFINETTEETSEYLFNMKNNNKVLAIVLLPVVCFMAWTPFIDVRYFMFTGVILTAILYLFTLGRGFRILMKKQFSVFYLFLYLCTLEFLFLLLFIKVI